MKFKAALFAAIFSLATTTFAMISVPISLLGDKSNQSIGTVTLTDSPLGLIVIPNLKSLPPGLHGFHLHTNPSCDDHGKAAGGHFDPKNTGKHLGPYNKAGHLGDLPVLYVDQKGNATMSMLAPRLAEKDFKGHALMIHEGSDNYSDIPKKLGGGGARLACGIIN